MSATPGGFQQQLAQLFGDTGMTQLFERTTVYHRRIEQDFCQQMTSVFPQYEFTFPYLELSDWEYCQKNLFSIFLLSIIESLEIPYERLYHYGLIIHAIRGVVTAIDNVLDDEQKGSVFLHMGQANVVPNILLMLLQNGMIHQSIAQLTDDLEKQLCCWQALMRVMGAILHEESGEESRILEALPPDLLLQDIHSFRGGQLFQLAFVMPTEIETHLASALSHMKDGVFAFGLTIQLLDDICDLADDMRDSNHNMLRSWIVHHGMDGAFSDAALFDIDYALLQKPEEHFPETTRALTLFAVRIVMDGFAHLRAAGYPMSDHNALTLLHMLFHVRGIQRLFTMYQDVILVGGQAIERLSGRAVERLSGEADL